MKLHINLHQADAVHSIKQCYVTSHSGVWIIEALYALDEYTGYPLSQCILVNL